jgi:hypothetical protein
MAAIADRQDNGGIRQDAVVRRGFSFDEHIILDERL